jgi:hypothetical protein
MIIPVFCVFGDQFISRIEVDENDIMIYREYDISFNEYLDDIDTLQIDLSNNTSYKNATWILKKLTEIEKFAPTYYDINLKPITIYEIKKYTSNTYNEFEIGYGYLLYKTIDVVRDKILNYIYFNFENEWSGVNPTKFNLYIKPNETASGVINLYNNYGKLQETYFHINGKINGKKTLYIDQSDYLEPDTVIIENYIDGIKEGEYIRISNCSDYIYKTNGTYKNNIREGEFINTINDKIDTITFYENNREKSVKRFHKNNNLYLENMFNNYDLVYHKSYYESGKILLSIIKNDETFHITHYYENGKVAWKSSFTKSLNSNIIHEIYDNDGMTITIDEFNEKYIDTQLRPKIIYKSMRFRQDVDVYNIFYNPFNYISRKYI